MTTITVLILYLRSMLTRTGWCQYFQAHLEDEAVSKAAAVHHMLLAVAATFLISMQQDLDCVLDVVSAVRTAWHEHRYHAEYLYPCKSHPDTAHVSCAA